jgi:hypothetical protein
MLTGCVEMSVGWVCVVLVESDVEALLMARWCDISTLLVARARGSTTNARNIKPVRDRLSA